MQQILQNTKRLVSVSLATLLILVSTITIFPSTASADNNVVKKLLVISLLSTLGVTDFLVLHFFLNPVDIT